MRTPLLALLFFTVSSIVAAGVQNEQVSQTIDDRSIMRQSNAQTDLVRLIQRALKILGYDPGPLDGEVGTRTQRAFDQYRESKGLAETEAGLLLTLESLALDLATKRPDDSKAIHVATELSSTLQSGLTDVSNQDSISRCDDGHWVTSVRLDGQMVALEDGSVFEINRPDRADTMSWRANEEILICGRKLANMDAGDAVLATRIR